MNDRNDYPPIDLGRVKTHSINERPGLVDTGRFATVTAPDASAAEMLDGLPDILGGRAFRELVDAIVTARSNDRPVVFAMGAHVLKVGLGPLLIDLIDCGVITAIALNGAGAIHDIELALTGTTSEDVARRLEDGSFGMVTETAEAIANGAERGSGDNIGLGRALGLGLLEARCPHNDVSVLAAAAKAKIPLTVHVAIGTDIVHMQQTVDPAKLGSATHIDFRILSSVTADLDGGVWLNIGSAVVLPEVFLKALTIARNICGKPDDFTTANLDMIQHYRPRVNVVQRPGGKGITLTGQHELLIPLLRQGVLSKL